MLIAGAILGAILAVAALRSSPPPSSSPPVGCASFADQARVWREGRTAGPDATERMEALGRSLVDCETLVGQPTAAVRRALGRPDLFSRDLRGRLLWDWYLSGEPDSPGSDILAVTAERHGRVVSAAYVEPTYHN